jgi:hypothetical protein
MTACADASLRDWLALSALLLALVLFLEARRVMASARETLERILEETLS